MTLHTVNKPGTCLTRCLALVSEGDAVLLLEDGVYTAMDTQENTGIWQTLDPKISCFALSTDLAARGISDKMLARFEVISWQQFVSLATEHDKVASWG